MSNNMQICEKEIAVLLATYNGEAYLSEQLDSLLNQTYKGFCCYIHDDGSSDRTESIILEYCRNNPDKFVYLGNEPTGGAKNNFLYLMQHVSAPYIMFCDQDDYWLEEKIEKSLIAMKAAEKDRESAICVFCDLCVVDSRLNEINPSFFDQLNINPQKTKGKELKTLLLSNYIPGCTMLINRKLHEEASKVSNVEDIDIHDWWCALVCAAVGGRFVQIEESLSLYRQHSNNVIGVPKKLTTLEKLKRIKRWSSARLCSYNQAAVLASVLSADNENIRLIKAFLELKEKKKGQRIYFHYREDVFAHVGSRSKLWQAVFRL